jgi:hypothetical protein
MSTKCFSVDIVGLRFIGHMSRYCYTASAVLLVIHLNIRIPKYPFTVSSTAVRQHNSFQKLKILVSVSFTSSFDSKYSRYLNVVTCLFSVVYGWWHCQHPVVMWLMNWKGLGCCMILLLITTLFLVGSWLQNVICTYNSWIYFCLSIPICFSQTAHCRKYWYE